MFEQSLLEINEEQAPRRKPLAVAASVGLQILVIGLLILIPLFTTEALPKDQLYAVLLAPPPPPSPPPPPAAEPARTQPQPQPKAAQPNLPRVQPEQLSQLQAPRSIPKQIAMVNEGAPPPPASNNISGVPGGVEGGVPGGAMGGVIGGVLAKATPPPPKPKLIRVGGNVQEGKLLNNVMPTYPAAAKQGRIEGTVRLEAIIGEDGRVQNLQVASGHPLLAEAAVQAVRQWRYKPTYLNGQPVQVSTIIEVNFKLT